VGAPGAASPVPGATHLKVTKRSSLQEMAFKIYYFIKIKDF
jgi:hypothetical protein